MSGTLRVGPVALRGLLALLLWLVAGPAQALCISPLCSCSVTTTNVVFGNHNPLASSNTDSTGSVRVGCGGVAGLLIPYQIDITRGGGASYGARRMNSGANQLAYNLYTDNTYLTAWGDGSGGSQSVSSGILLDVLGLSPQQTHWIYGRIPGSQTTAVPGSYIDTITVTVTYN